MTRKNSFTPFILNTLERKFLILIGDLTIVFLALKVFINQAIDDDIFNGITKWFFYSICMVFYLFISYVLNFYNLEKSFKTRTALSQSMYIVGSYVFSIFLGTLILFDTSFWRLPLIVFLILPPIEIFLWRYFFGSLFKVIKDKKNVLYLYDESTLENKDQNISLINGLDIETIYKTKLTYALEETHFLGKQKFINAIDKVDAFILDIQNYSKLSKDVEGILLDAITKGKEVLSFTSFYENTYEALPIKSHNDSFYEVLQLRNLKIRYFQSLFTFFVNFMLILLVGLVLLIVTPFVWFVNLFFNKGPLFYIQKRVGRHGEEFPIYKFRSMVVDAEKYGAQMATSNDSRITPFGKILRVFRIDELPQIISVIKGDMKFIGPRPERKIFVDQLNELVPFYNTRHLVKPGITGWAQVKYKYGEDLEDSIKKLEYDLYYIKNRSITLDIRIIFKTVTTILFSKGV